MARDDFPPNVKDLLARRAGMRCSNPECAAMTVGPQEGGSSSVNLGVACHITAAAPGGPRFDGAIDKQTRRSERNGLWLCQTCAKWIDSDPVHYSVALLECWKAQAEQRALAELGVTAAESFYPQPAAANHTPIPRIQGLSYDTARGALLNAGWQPILRHWSDADSPDIVSGNGPYFWDKGYREIHHASGTGLGYCSFIHRDVYGNRLVVVTAGDAIESALSPTVWSWYLLGVTVTP